MIYIEIPFSDGQILHAASQKITVIVLLFHIVDSAVCKRIIKGRICLAPFF